MSSLITNIVKGESNRRKLCFRRLPSRILYPINIQKMREQKQMGTKFSDLSLPNRIPYSFNIRESEQRGKQKQKTQICRTHPIRYFQI